MDAAQIRKISKDSGIDEIKHEPVEYKEDNLTFDFPRVESQNESHHHETPFDTTTASAFRIQPKIELPDILEFFILRAERLNLDISSLKMYTLGDISAPPVPLLSLIPASSHTGTFTSYANNQVQQQNDQVTSIERKFAGSTSPKYNDRVIKNAPSKLIIASVFSTKPSPYDLKKCKIVATRLEDETDEDTQRRYRQFLNRQVKVEQGVKEKSQKKKQKKIQPEQEENLSAAASSHLKWVPDELEDKFLEELPSPPPKPIVKKRPSGRPKREVKNVVKFTLM